MTAWFTSINARRFVKLCGALIPSILSTVSFIAAITPVRAAVDSDKPTFDITFDDTAVRELIRMVKAKDESDTSIDAWLNLPANKYILSIGEKEQNLTRDQFRKNLIAEIEGTATPQSQPPTDIGCLWMSSAQDYSDMLDRLDDTTSARIARIAAHLAAFSPKGVHVKETVYLHLGGDWDAVNDHGNIYVNIRFWHDLHRPSWHGINMIIAHESMHTVQNMTYGNPEYQDGATPAFLTALSKIQREGTARYVEYDTDPEPYAVETYGFVERAITSESYRSFPKDIDLLENLYKDCFPAFDHDKFVEDYADGIGNGGPYYDVGYGMAKAIDDHLGRTELIDTVVHGPKLFFTLYNSICATDPRLPTLPQDVMTAVQQMPEKIDPAMLEGNSTSIDGTHQK